MVKNINKIKTLGNFWHNAEDVVVNFYNWNGKSINNNHGKGD